MEMPEALIGDPGVHGADEFLIFVSLQDNRVSCGADGTASRGGKRKRPEEAPGLHRFSETGLIVHTAHTAHTAARHSRSSAVLLWPFGHHGFRGDQKPGDRCRVLQGRPNNFGRINDALADEVHVFAVLGVEAESHIDPFQGSCRRRWNRPRPR